MKIINNFTRIVNKSKLNQAIGDTGTTGNFVRPGAPVDDIKVAVSPIEIQMLNGSIEKARIRAFYPRISQRIEGGAHCAWPVPFFPNINQKVVQRRMRRYFQRQNM